MANTRSVVLSLYKRMLRESYKFPGYNYRQYAIRRIRYGFQQNKGLSDPKAVNELVKNAQDAYELLQRQVRLNEMYKVNQLIIETQTNASGAHQT